MIKDDTNVLTLCKSYETQVDVNDEIKKKKTSLVIWKLYPYTQRLCGREKVRKTECQTCEVNVE